VDRSWFVPVATGGSAFIVEADAAAGIIGQALCDRDDEDDLDIMEVGQGFTMIKKLADAQGHFSEELGDKYIRILLAHGDQEMKSGEPGHRYTLRSYVESQREADIFIEGGKKTMSHLLLSWIDNRTEEPGRKRIIFDTYDEDVFNAVKAVVPAKEWEFRGRSGLLKGEGSGAEMEKDHIIIYDRNAAATIHKAEQLILHHEIEANDICLLLDTVEGVDQINALSEHLGISLSYICIAEAYDELFEASRKMVRSGLQISEIQKKMDEMVDKNSDFIYACAHNKSKIGGNLNNTNTGGAVAAVGIAALL